MSWLEDRAIADQGILDTAAAAGGAARPLTEPTCCRCACHLYPNVYPSTPDQPCQVCAHVDDDGAWIGGANGYWLSHPAPQAIPPAGPAPDNFL